MKKIAGLGSVCGLLIVAVATFADDESDLVQLDQEWGEARSSQEVEGLLADNVIGISPEGLIRRPDMLAEVEGAAPSGPYMAEDYETQFLTDDIAVMVHRAGGDDAHWSLHVWQKIDDEWQVAATANVPTTD